MNRRVLIGIIIAVVGVGLIGLGILAINRVLRQSLAPAAPETPVAEASTSIIITTRDLAVGTVINREDVETVSVPVSLVPRDALLSVESALGKMAIVHLIQGEMVLQHHLADPTNVSHDIGYIIEDNQVLMAFPSNDLMSTLGVLQRGDAVDIFASITVEVSPTNTTPPVGTTTEQQQMETRLFTIDALQQVQVSAIVADVVTQPASSSSITGGAQPTPAPSPTKVKAYLLALDAQDALVLKHMKDAGAVFDIVLRSPTSKELFEVSPVMEEYLIQRYNLQIPK